MTESAQNVPSISTFDLEQKLMNGIKLIDVREPSEFQEGHIKNAENFPLGDIYQYQGNPKEKLYVICRSGRRSLQATEILRKHGYDAINVLGKMLNWHGEIVT